MGIIWILKEIFTEYLVYTKAWKESDVSIALGKKNKEKLEYVFILSETHVISRIYIEHDAYVEE